VSSRSAGAGEPSSNANQAARTCSDASLNDATIGPWMLHTPASAQSACSAVTSLKADQPLLGAPDAFEVEPRQEPRRSVSATGRYNRGGFAICKRCVECCESRLISASEKASRSNKLGARRVR